MPGCGSSSDPPEGFRDADFADCLAAFIDALGLGRPHVLGLSFGAALALELYRRHPTVLRTLVLASAYAGWAGSLPPDMVEQRIQRVSQAIGLPPEQWAREWTPSMLSPSAPQKLVHEVETLLAAYHPAGQRVILQAFAHQDLRDVLPRIAVPTLLLYGGADVRSPVSVGEDLHAQIPGSQLVVIPSVGHMCNLEAPARFNEEVRRFFQSVGS
jgi:pimeloyl-ACP methyl ester carboxylesterase